MLSLFTVALLCQSVVRVSAMFSGFTWMFVTDLVRAETDSFIWAVIFEGVLNLHQGKMLVFAFNTAIGCYKADSSFNLFNQRNFYIAYLTFCKTQWSFCNCRAVSVFIYCNTSPVWIVFHWRYAGFMGFHQEVDRRKHCAAASRSHIIGVLLHALFPTEMIVCIISLLTTFNILLH